MSNKDLIGISANPYRTAFLTNLVYPSGDGGWRDIFRSGWLPSWFNQQWGGAQIGHEMVDAATGVMYKFEPATGQIQDDTAATLGSAASNYYVSQGFKASESFTLDACWLKLYKVQGATATNYTLTVRVYSDNAGSPNVALGTAVTLSMRLVTSKSDGEWYRISGLSCALTANTQYHIVLSTLTTVDAATAFGWKYTTMRKYPHGFANNGTSVPAWTQVTGSAYCFLVEPPAANKFMQSGGLFDQKLVFTTSSPVNQSKLLCQPARNFFDGRSGTMLHRGTYAANSVIMDVAYGLDHDRLLVTVNSSGNVVATLYKKDRTNSSVISSSTVTTGNHDVAVIYRVAGDGSDYLKLIVDGVTQAGSLSGQTFSVDPLFRELATAWLGGGFAAAPVWTQDMQMTALPSAQGWTWTGTATEANAMSVTSGRLFQNKTGYASTDTGYYSKTTTLSNANGWCVTFKTKITNASNTLYSPEAVVAVSDGTKVVGIHLHEYYLETYYTNEAADFVVQGDFKSQDHVFTLCGKGSDYYLFIDGKLVIDGTGKLVGTTATNSIIFGDAASVAGENADVTWSYIKYYQGGMLLPAANGASLSEFAYWSEAQEAVLGGVYHATTPISVKKYCGLERNYIENIVQREDRYGVANSLSTSSTTPVLLTDLESYIVGSTITDSYNCSITNNVGSAASYVYSYIDGSVLLFSSMTTSGASSPVVPAAATGTRVSYLGLHKTELRFCTSATATAVTNGPRVKNTQAKS